MDNRRIFGIIASIIFLIVFGWAILDALEEKCHTPRECTWLGILTISTIFGTILLIETYVAHRKATGMWKQKKVNSNKRAGLTSSQIWLRSIIRVALSSILLGLPLIFQGAFIVAFAGFMIGFWIDIMIRAISNQFPPSEPDEEVH